MCLFSHFLLLTSHIFIYQRLLVVLLFSILIGRKNRDKIGGKFKKETKSDQIEDIKKEIL